MEHNKRRRRRRGLALASGKRQPSRRVVVVVQGDRKQLACLFRLFACGWLREPAREGGSWTRGRARQPARARPTSGQPAGQLARRLPILRLLLLLPDRSARSFSREPLQLSRLFISEPLVGLDTIPRRAHLLPRRFSSSSNSRALDLIRQLIATIQLFFREKYSRPSLSLALAEITKQV